jgi:hypothetical protein
MKSRRLIAVPDDYNKGILSTCTGRSEGVDVRFGSKADIWLQKVILHHFLSCSVRLHRDRIATICLPFK